MIMMPAMNDATRSLIAKPIDTAIVPPIRAMMLSLSSTLSKITVMVVGQDADLEEKIRLRRAWVGKFMLGLSDWGAVETAMAKMNLAWGQVRNAATMAEHPTVSARGAIVQIDDREGGTRPIPQSPYRFSAAKSGVRGPAPHRGEHNAEVLGDWLGCSAAEVGELEQQQVLQRDEAAGG